jgi:hypothetical protein
MHETVFLLRVHIPVKPVLSDHLLTEVISSKLEVEMHGIIIEHDQVAFERGGLALNRSQGQVSLYCIHSKVKEAHAH